MEVFIDINNLKTYKSLRGLPHDLLALYAFRLQNQYRKQHEASKCDKKQTIEKIYLELLSYKSFLDDRLQDIPDDFEYRKVNRQRIWALQECAEAFKEGFNWFFKNYTPKRKPKKT